MSNMPWGTMNNWLRIEAEQRNAWTQLRVQDLRAAQVEPRPAHTAWRPVRRPALRPTPAACTDAA